VLKIHQIGKKTMGETYFSKFPIITYLDYQVRNITERVSIITKEKSGSMVYYPYELGNELRADQLADSYYRDADLDWIIYLSNDIVDPYYGWHIYDMDFEDYIIDKYGDIDDAEQRIAFFRTNWPIDIHVITPKYFDDLDGAFKKYYQPKWGAKRTILGYERRQDDITVNTNKIVQYSITMSNGAFTNGELLVINYLGDDSGRCECITANDTVLITKNHVDNTSIGVIRSRSNTSVQATINSVTTLVENIPNIEEAYWEAVSMFDVERENNEHNRFLDVLADNYVFPTAEEIRKQLLPTRGQ
jgi:hypothetical protein